MKGDKEIWKKAKGFDVNPQNINRTGANRKLISTINKELNEQGFEVAQKQDVVDCYLTLIQLPVSKVQEIANIDNDDYPFLYKLVAKEMMGKRGADMLEKLLDRSLGKADQYIDQTTEHSGKITIVREEITSKD